MTYQLGKTEAPNDGDGTATDSQSILGATETLLKKGKA